MLIVQICSKLFEYFVSSIIRFNSPMRIPKNFDGKLVTQICGVLPCGSQAEVDDFEGTGCPKNCLFVRNKQAFSLGHLVGLLFS